MYLPSIHRNYQNLLIGIDVCHITVEPVLEDSPIGYENVVSQDRWSLIEVWNLLPGIQSFKTGGLMAVVSQDRFHM